MRRLSPLTRREVAWTRREMEIVEIYFRGRIPKTCHWFRGRGGGKGNSQCDTWEDWEPVGRRLWKEQKDSHWGLWSLRFWGDFLGALAEEPGPRSEGRPLLSLPNFKFKCGPGASSLPKGKVLRRLFFPHNNAQPLLERAYGWDLGRRCRSRWDALWNGAFFRHLGSSQKVPLCCLGER